jgi:hypothetical protein
MQASYTADASFDIARQVNKAICDKVQTTDPARLTKLKNVQQRIEALKRRGLLKPQQYSVPSSTDFKKMFSTQS